MSRLNLDDACDFDERREMRKSFYAPQDRRRKTSLRLIKELAKNSQHLPLLWKQIDMFFSQESVHVGINSIDPNTHTFLRKGLLFFGVAVNPFSCLMFRRASIRSSSNPGKALEGWWKKLKMMGRSHSYIFR